MLCLRVVRFRSPSCIFIRDLYRIRSAPQYHPLFRSDPPVHRPQTLEVSLRLMMSIGGIHWTTAANVSPKSRNNSTKPSDTALPKGWTDDRFYLQIDTFPSKALSLPTGKSILYNDRRSVHLIDCSGTYYLWNEVGDGVDQILEPKNLPDIYKALEVLEAGDVSKLKTQALQP